jgi:hypothetical protein
MVTATRSASHHGRTDGRLTPADISDSAGAEMIWTVCASSGRG